MTPDPGASIEPSADLAAAHWAELRGRLMGFAVRLVWNRDDAEEIVQEAFALCLKSPQRPAAPHCWLMRTVANLALNRRRRRRPEPLAEWHMTNDAGPSERATSAEQLDRVRAALERLAPQRRLALVLRTMEGLSYAEVAAVMEISEPAARTHVHLARRELADRLHEPEADR